MQIMPMNAFDRISYFAKNYSDDRSTCYRLLRHIEESDFYDFKQAQHGQPGRYH